MNLHVKYNILDSSKCASVRVLPLTLVKAVLPLSAPHQNKTKLLSLIVPRQPSNDLFETFEIERGVSADDEAKDDPGEILIFSVPL